MSVRCLHCGGDEHPEEGYGHAFKAFGLSPAELAQRRANGQKIRDRYGPEHYVNLGRKGGSVTLEERRLRALEQEQRQQAALTKHNKRKGAAQAPIQRGGGKGV